MPLPLACTVTLVCLAACAAALGAAPAVGPVRVEIRKTGDAFRLYRGGKPYRVKGAVYAGDVTGRFPLSDVAARGGNSVRCGSDRRLLDEANRLGMTALVGLHMGMEAVHKFDYGDPKAVREQFDRAKATVLALKDHPAVLLWTIGNELSMNYTDHKVWDAVNDVARMIHEVDGNHPALTVIGDGSIQAGDIKLIRRQCPDLDLLGINYYKDVETVPAKVRENGWDRPYVVTEWGPSGDWQVPRTAWGASIEETSTEKAQRYLERYRATAIKDADRCLGSYVFIWGPRHERTHTWYGMFLASGERTEAVNAMQYVWSGTWPANRAPRVADLRIDGRAAGDDVTLAPGTAHEAVLDVTEPDGDPMTFQWAVMPEVPRAGYAGMGERRASPMPDLVERAEGGRLRFKAPAKEGPYRVFVYVLDGQGNGATANIPFLVK